MSKPNCMLIVVLVLSITTLISGNAAKPQSPPLPTGTFVVDAAEDFIRSTGAPVTVTRTFTVLNPTASYKLRVYNGGRNGQFTRISSAMVSLNGHEIVGTSDLGITVAFTERDVPLLASNAFTVELRSQPGSGISIEFIGIDNDPPAIVASVNPRPDVSGWNSADVTVSFTCSDSISGISSCPQTVVVSTETPGQVVTGTATDRAGNAATTSVTVKLDKTSPAVAITSPADGAVVQSPALTLTGTATDSLSGIATLLCNTASINPPQSPFSCGLTLNPGPNQITVEATDTAGNTARSTRSVSYVPASSGLPPDPSSVAPPLPLTQMTTFAAATEFLYSGANPIQTGVAAGTIDAIRAAVLRGKAKARDGAPLPGVRVTILNHPEFGQTLSRSDGRFDMAVNGGGPLIVRYDKPGLLPAQRQVDVAWRDFVSAPEVILIPYDTQGTLIDLTSMPGGPVAPKQVARGSVMTDADGARQATVLFPQGATASMLMPDGSTIPLMKLTVRATEYTVGTTGAEAMPAGLPPTSGYTYAVELSADEAIAAGAAEVRFSTPLPFYLENFLGFPVGTTAPLGSYDLTRGGWLPDDSGRVIKILSVTGGMADLDVTGDNLADTGTTLSALAITDPERQQLALLYTPGQSLWRVRVPHFSAWDINWGIAPPDTASAPDQDPDSDKARDCQSQHAGSIVSCQNQSLGEAVGVPGTPFVLYYQSDHTPGNKAAYSVEIPLGGAQMPPGVQGIELEVFVAGQVHTANFSPAANQRTTFTWDGKDVYGRTLQGVQRITVRIGYTYAAVYSKTSRFGYNGSGLISGVRSRRTVTLWRKWEGVIGAWDARGVGLGGWTLNTHHTFDPIGGVLYRGDGRTQSSLALGPIIKTAAGGVSAGQLGCDAGGDGGPATAAEVCPRALASSADGSIYIVDLAQRVRRIGPSGLITTVAGTGVPGFSGDGGPATQARLHNPTAIAIGADGAIYIGENQNRRVRRVDANGIIMTVAGNGNSCPAPNQPCGDGGLATSATVIPQSLAIGPDGSLFIGDGNTRRIRKVSPDGIISTVAGTGGFCANPTDPCGDGGPATSAGIFSPDSIAIGRDGSIYIGDSAVNRVRRVTPDGIIRTIAGTGAQGFSGDGSLAKQATFRGVGAITLGGDESVYVFDAGNRRIRWVRPDGTITTIAGTGTNAVTGDGGLAAQAALMQPDQPYESGMTISANGSLYLSQSGSSGPLPRVRQIASRVEGLAFDGGGFAVNWDGTEVYILASGGRHMRTVDALTGATRYEFTYDSAGRLSGITDGDGNTTGIERNATGQPTALVSPFGQRTNLVSNADGYLERITTPIGETTQITYTASGLLTDFTDPRSNISRYAYDPQGRLIRATDATGATQTMVRSGTNRDYTVTRTSPLGQTIAYRVQYLPTGETRLTTTSPAAQVQTVIGTNGTQSATLPDGTTVSLSLGHDPRWGVQAPVVTNMTVRTPAGRVYTRSSQRTAALSNSTNPLSLTGFTETTTVNGQVETMSYSAATRTITHTSPGGRRATVSLDVKGRPLQSQYANLEPNALAYDSRGRLLMATSGTGANSRVTQFGYGLDGYLAGIVDPLNQTTTMVADANGRMKEQSLPGGVTVGFNYDGNSNLTALIPPSQSAHTFSYSERDETSIYHPPVVGSEFSQFGFAYDLDRRPLRVDRPGDMISFNYDFAGRLQRVQLPSSFRDYGYDSAGRLVSISSAGIALSYSYDGGLATGTTWSGAVAGSVSHVFDNNFRVTSEIVNGANPIATAFDNDGLAIQAGALTMTRNSQTGLITATSLGQITDATTYDSFGAVSAYTSNRNGNAVYAVSYSRDPLSRITSKTETVNGIGSSFAYSYDPAGRLREVRRNGAVAATYSYDGNGNRTSMTAGTTVSAAYDAQDRITQSGTTTYTHSATGNLIGKTTATGTTAYRYDGLNTLTSLTLPGSKQIDYLVDGEGRRVGKLVNGTLVQGWLYQDSLRPIAELDDSGAVRTRFVYAGVSNVPAYMIKGGVTYRIIVDHLGSPRFVIDAGTGAIAQELNYDAFGVVVQDSNPGFQPFGFAGGLYDPDTSLVRFGARDYDAETGRWTTKDPIGFLGSDTNLYGYVRNDPVNYIDALGTGPELISRVPLPGTPVYERVLAAVTRTGLAAGREAAVTAQLVRIRGIGANLSNIRAYIQVLGRPAGGFISAELMASTAAVTASFIGGYALGSWLNDRFCLSDRISDFAIELTQMDPATAHKFEQFKENRSSLGFSALIEFGKRCTGGGTITAFCAGLTPY